MSVSVGVGVGLGLENFKSVGKLASQCVVGVHNSKCTHTAEKQNKDEERETFEFHPFLKMIFFFNHT